MIKYTSNSFLLEAFAVTLQINLKITLLYTKKATAIKLKALHLTTHTRLNKHVQKACSISQKVKGAENILLQRYGSIPDSGKLIGVTQLIISKI